MAAVRTLSSSAQANEWPLGFMVIWYGMKTVLGSLPETVGKRVAAVGVARVTPPARGMKPMTTRTAPE